MSQSRLKKIGAAAGIAFPIVQMIAQGLIQVGGVEPSFSAPSSEIIAFFESRNPSLFAIGDYLSTLSLVLFLWFLGVLWDELRMVEGGNGWLSVIVIGSGIATVSALAGGGGWSLALFRIGEGLEPQIARLLFDQGNLNFANIWISLGSMVLAAGILFQQTASFPRWLGWSSIALAIGLFLARIVWTSPIAFLPYVLFWVWMIALGIIILRRSQQSLINAVTPKQKIN